MEVVAHFDLACGAALLGTLQGFWQVDDVRTVQQLSVFISTLTVLSLEHESHGKERIRSAKSGTELCLYNCDEGNGKDTSVRLLPTLMEIQMFVSICGWQNSAKPVFNA